MTGKPAILVTGLNAFWGSRVAAQLAARADLHVIGLADTPPEEMIEGLDFIQADVRNPLIVKLLEAERVDTVCHVTFVETARSSESAFDLNVMGTMKLLGACAEAGVRKVVLKSSTMVYGANPGNSAFLPENHPLQASRSYEYTRDLVEIEAFCNGFRGQAPGVLLTLLRFAHIVGPKADTPLTRFLREEQAPSLLGFDPMMQVIHEDDVVRALLHAVLNDVPGVFNVAAEGVMPLWKVMGLAGKLPIPFLHPLAYLGVSLLGPAFAPIALDYLRYPCVGDLGKMRSELGFVPQYTAEEALREFAAQQRLRKYLPESVARAYDEERLHDTIERRRRARTLDSEPAAPRSRGRASGKRAPAARSRTQRRAKPPTGAIGGKR